MARIEEIAPDVVLIDLGNPSRDVLEEYFAVSRALARPIAMFVDQSDDEAIARRDRRRAFRPMSSTGSTREPDPPDARSRGAPVQRLRPAAVPNSTRRKRKLAERDAIDKAKRILMKQPRRR